eukprot:scaffold22551_cov29-Tisochrysis_lutea.AAC.2
MDPGGIKRTQAATGRLPRGSVDRRYSTSDPTATVGSAASGKGNDVPPVTGRISPMPSCSRVEVTKPRLQSAASSRTSVAPTSPVARSVATLNTLGTPWLANVVEGEAIGARPSAATLPAAAITTGSSARSQCAVAGSLVRNCQLRRRPHCPLNIRLSHRPKAINLVGH